MNSPTFPETCALDPNRLEALRIVAGKVIAQCPQCAAGGRDTAKDNLAIFESGAFYCITGCDAKAIHSLAGRESDWKPDPDEKRRWQKEQAQRRRQEAEQEARAKAAQEYRRPLIDRHRWTSGEILADSPVRLDRPMLKNYPDRAMLAALFAPDALLWTGEVYESGTAHAARWQKTSGHHSTAHRCGSMTTPATWKEGTTSRTRDNVATSPYTVLDFDGFDGTAPTTPDELRAHLADSAAIIRWMREDLHWRLAAIVFTGSKSLHAWFHTPPQQAIADLRSIAPQLGIDAGLVGHPEHPCRLPGHRHEKTGNTSRLLWLDHAAR
ncbi:small VCP/p97-interacting protein [Sulfuriroseicoccus oceanibius]|uniref:Uncharacterized protein n=1 Tax=Sulfuriroseicoccus oceanibius TaxID=2707525 RepID=A0A6B3L0X5_9BACT|nr:small VCP/p97-interacting protein [Sulfuriroseicoccus oceanibius]QQL44233.1 hypothetical protein G3M56_010040 [Sulfuriroseicoccus oceanibius]